MRNFYSRFLESVAQWPQNVAVEMRRVEAPGAAAGQPASAAAVEHYTYAELRRMAESVGRWLQQNGMARGTRCALLGANGPRWVAAYLGVIAAGGVAVPFDTAFSPAQVAKLLRDSGSSFLFTDVKHLWVASRALEGLDVKLVLLDASPEDSGGRATLDAMLAAGPGGFVPADAGLEEIAVILYTSGTTADPKGVMLTHDNLLGEMEAVLGLLDVNPSDAILGVLPLFHALAQMANLLIPFAVGARVVYLESLNVGELLRALRESQVTLFCCVPQFFYLIHERVMKQVKERALPVRLTFRLLMGLSRLMRPLGWNLGKVFFRQAHEALGARMRYLVTGGSRFDAAIGRDLHALGFDVLQAYGLTETSGGALCTPPKHNVIGSVGRPLPGIEVRIVDAQPREDSAGPPEGEIAIRGRIVMKGYWNRPDATAEVLRDDWLQTGDLGYLDPGGNLFITGRRKEVIVLSSGKNIYPEELEAHYLKSPFIKEICVMGLESRPGEPFAERLHAVVAPNFDVLRERKIVNMKEVLRFDIEGLSAQLPSTKRILSYDIWQEELPRTTTRKLKRFEIHKKVLEQGARAEAEAEAPPRRWSDEDRAWLENPDVQRALAVVRQASKSGRTEISPSDNLELDLGLDSMGRVELLVALERELGAKVDEDVLSSIYTVRELVEAGRAGMGAASTGAAFFGWEAVFATESTDPDVLAITQPHLLATMLWFLVGRLANLLCRDLFQLRVTGLEKLPERGPFILSPNHQSYLDPAVLVSLLPWPLLKNSFSVGTSDIFGQGFMRWLARSLRVIPVDPDVNLVPAMRAGSYGLRRGMMLVLFPEGERSIDGQPKVFKKGAAILAIHHQVPIYPVALDGFYEAWPRGKSFQRFARLRIAFGDPIFPPKNPTNHEAAYEQLTAELRTRVVEMWERLRERNEEPPRNHRALAAD